MLFLTLILGEKASAKMGNAAVALRSGGGLELIRRMIVALWLALAAAAGEPRRIDVFVAGTHGYFTYRIPGIVVTPKGTVIAYAEARKTNAADWGAIDIVTRRSEDGGASWLSQHAIGKVLRSLKQNPAAASVARPPDAITYNNPVAIVDRRKGIVHFLFCVEYMQAFYMRSTDDGRTFSPPVEITSTFEKFRPEYPWKVIATGPGHGIQLRNGRLIMPVWLSTADGGNPHRPNVVATIYSDDHGNNWRGGEIAVRTAGEVVNPNETVAEQLADGKVMLNVRSPSPAHRRIVAVSEDGATKWSAPRFQQELLEPVCFGSLVRYGRTSSRGPNRLLFVNPDNLERIAGHAEPGQSRDRRNLTVQLSEDDGATWKVKRVLDPGWAGYSDINVAKDGTILCLYERGEPNPKQLRIAALTLARFSLEWLTEPQR